MADFNSLILKRQSQIDRLNRILKVAQEAEKDAAYLASFRAAFKTAELAYKVCQKITDEILDSISTDSEKTEAVKKQDKDREKTTAGLIDEYFWQINIKYEALFGDVSTAPGASSSNIKLPSLSLPIFDGKLTEWSAFKDMYNSMVHNNNSLTNIQKFFYLISSLRNEPLTLVKAVNLSNTNYPIALNQLFSRYDSKRRVASAHWQKICDLPSSVSDNSSSLFNLVSVVTENLAALSAIGLPAGEWGYIMFDMIFKKLPKSLCTKFEDQADKDDFPDFEQLKKFITEHCKALESVEALCNKKQVISQPVSNSKGSQKHSFVVNKIDSAKNMNTTPFHAGFNRNQCAFCKNSSHSLSNCQNFLQNNPADRLGIVKQFHLCINCLQGGHSVRNCSSIYSCKICKKRHHSVLHFDSDLVSKNNISVANVVSDSVSSATRATITEDTKNNHGPVAFTAEANSSVLLSTALVHVQSSRNTFEPVRVLLDSGSQVSFISSKCLNRLGLPRSKFCTNITGINADSPVISQGTTSCAIKPLNSSGPILRTDFLILPKLITDIPSSPINIDQWKHISQLPLADPDWNKVKPVEMILGADIFSEMFLSGQVAGGPGEPVALNTIFGWILMGKVKSFSPKLVSMVSIAEPFDLKKFWELEQVPEKLHVSPDDQLCEEIYKSTVSRTDDGRYIVALPFKEPEPVFLGDSQSVALKRLFSLEKRFSKDQSLKKSYSDIMQEYLDLGLMQVASPCGPEVPTFYLPHHCVFKIDGSFKKLRIVLDASAKTPENRSLNDCLLSGPKLQSDIASLLINFRILKYVLTADVKGMFLQILVKDSHRNYQRLLWRFNDQDPVQEYVLNTVTFGVTSSPYLAQRTIKQLVADEGHNFPLAAKALTDHLYVDDACCGASTLKEAKQLRFELVALLKKGKFELRKWASNCPELLGDIPPDERQSINFDSSDGVLRILGLQWLPSSDCFAFNVSVIDNIPTKRSILSDVARIWDPLGFLAPITFFSKHLIQYLWSLGLDWDETPPLNVVEKWRTFKSELPLLCSLKIQRFLDIDYSCSQIELHGFSDSSEKGYAACVYLRFIGTDGRIHVRFLSGKSKVATLSKISLPRLELCGAVLLSNLIAFVKKSLGNKIVFNQTFAWCDSSITLCWIKGLPHRWRTFVANRVSHIQGIVPPDCWRYVRSAENPADIATRGLLPKDFLESSLWFNGPDWLHLSKENWPKTSPTLLSNIEIEREAAKPAKLTCLVVQEDNFFDKLLQKFSSYRKIQRIIAYVLRFLNNLKNRTDFIGGALSQLELHSATIALCKHVQSTVFQEEISQIKSNKLCSKPFRKLTPFLDEQKVVRVGGRLTHSELSFDAKHPILIPKKHVLTNLLIKDFHNKFLHPGPQALHCLLLQQFWIISAKRAIRSCVSKCNQCFRSNPKSLVPVMGNLPAARVSQIKVFSKSAVDLGGPYMTSTRRYRGAKSFKSYICVFVCLATRAVHIELVSDLTSEAFLAAFRRFVARRGRVSDMYSDCGTNFVGANNLMLSYLKGACDNFAIKWHFNPPAAPHMGGLWEAAIKSVKGHISRVLGEQVVTFEEMTTLLAQIEAVLNSRPLGAMSTDPNDLRALTPNHFLTMESISAPPDEDLSNIKSNRLSRWQLVQNFHQSIWRRWHVEFLQTLQQRPKWYKPSADLVEGSLVIIKNENLPPGKWLLGRVQRLFPGSDGTVRVATVLTNQGILKRPLVKLCLLPTQ